MRVSKFPTLLHSCKIEADPLILSGRSSAKYTGVRRGNMRAMRVRLTFSSVKLLQVVVHLINRDLHVHLGLLLVVLELPAWSNSTSQNIRIQRGVSFISLLSPLLSPHLRLKSNTNCSTTEYFFSEMYLHLFIMSPANFWRFVSCKIMRYVYKIRQREIVSNTVGATIIMDCSHRFYRL